MHVIGLMAKYQKRVSDDCRTYRRKEGTDGSEAGSDPELGKGWVQIVHPLSIVRRPGGPGSLRRCSGVGSREGWRGCGGNDG